MTQREYRYSKENQTYLRIRTLVRDLEKAHKKGLPLDPAKVQELNELRVELAALRRGAYIDYRAQP